MAIDFRGFGCSSGPGQADFDNAPFENDVLAAVRYLKTHGVKTVSVVGGSFGGGAAGDASIKAGPGEIERIVFPGTAPNLPAEKLKSRAQFIVARDDANDGGPRLPGIRAQYEKAPQPKELIVFEWFRARPVSVSNRSERSSHARDPEIPLDAVIVRRAGSAQQLEYNIQTLDLQFNNLWRNHTSEIDTAFGEISSRSRAALFLCVSIQKGHFQMA